MGSDMLGWRPPPDYASEARKWSDLIEKARRQEAKMTEDNRVPHEHPDKPEDKHLGGPDDNHYSRLAVQPIEAIEAWAVNWPSVIAPHLGEVVWSVSRIETLDRGNGERAQSIRDLRKSAFMCNRAADILERK